MGILRKIRKDNFTTVSNDYLQDVELSWKAKGLITYLMSLPDDWKVNIPDLSKRSKDGRDAVMSTMKEIEINGYGRKVKSRTKDGKFDNFDFEVADTKVFNPLSENPTLDNPILENPMLGNPTLLNTNSKKKTNSTKNEKPQKQTSGDLFPEINPNKKTLFRNSIYADFERFKEKFSQPEFANVDLSYYFYSVKDWSDSANKQRTARGWIATARTFMRGDADKKKLRMLKTPEDNFRHDKDALNYLKGFE